jgi:hypothetical protein
VDGLAVVVVALSHSRRTRNLGFVMAGRVPAIHVFISQKRKQDMDHRDKPGDDGG